MGWSMAKNELIEGLSENQLWQKRLWQCLVEYSNELNSHLGELIYINILLIHYH